MTREGLAKLIGNILKDRSSLWGVELDIISMLSSKGFLYESNDEYHQFPTSQKHKAKLPVRCKEQNCTKRARTHGLCQTHYLKARRQGLVGEASVCTVEGCEKPVEARGLCFTHYRSATRAKMDQ